MKNVSAMLKLINKNYPFEMPVYGYVLITVAGTTLIILVTGVLLYVQYRWAKVTQPPVPKRNPHHLPSKEEIELQSLTLKSTNERIPHRRPVTPQLLCKILEEDLGVDFRKYNWKN